MSLDRYYKPSINMWKYIETNDDTEEVTDKDKNRVVKNSFRLVNWNLSFAKNCIQACFIIFLIANIFIMSLITIDFIRNGILEYFDSYINAIFGLMRDTIGVYIIKSCLENSFKITMSVLSDYIDKKYGTKLDPGSPNSPTHNVTIIGSSENKPVEGEMKDTDSEESYEEMAAAALQNANVVMNSVDDSEDGGVYKEEQKEDN